MARGRVPDDDETLERKRKAAYAASVKHDSDARSTCQWAGHNTYLFSRFCTRCGWILTDEEVTQLE